MPASPTARRRARRSATAPPIRRTRWAPRSRSRCCGCTRKAACSPTASASRAHFAAGLDALRDHPLVGDARHRGLLGALELVSDKATQARLRSRRSVCPTASSPPATATAWCSARFGDHILGFAPALTFTEDEFAQMFVRLKKTLDEVLAAPDVRAALAG